MEAADAEEQKAPTAKSRLKSFEATRGVFARGPGSNSSAARVRSASLGRGGYR